MQRTYRVPLARAGLIGLAAVAILLALPGTSIAGGTSEPILTGAQPLLQRGAGYDDAGQRASVRSLQRALRRLSWRPGPVDGLYGPQTEAAVQRLQGAAGLAPDGIVGPATRRALHGLLADRLRRGAGYATPEGSERVRRLQRELRRRGLDPGAVDGRFGPLTELALARLQHRAGLPGTGAVDRPTDRVLARASGAPSLPERVRAQKPDRARGERAQPGQRAGAERGGEPARRERSQQGERAGAKGREPARGRRAAGGQPPVERADARPAARTGVRTSAAAEPEGLALVAIVVGAAAVLTVGAFVGMMFARSRTLPGIAVPLAGGVVAEGEAPSIGHFRGQVGALVLGRRRFRRSPEAHYLVRTSPEEAPFWVAHSDVASIVTTGAPATGIRPKPPQPASDGVRVLGYTSIPDSEEDESVPLSRQAGEIDSHCEQRGWRLLEVVHDRDDGNGRALERPGLLYALDRIAKGDAACLVVPRLERLTRSVPDLARVIEAVRRGGGRLVVLDIALDTASAPGELAAETLVSVGAWERRRLGERTRKGLAAAKARRVVTGRPAVEDVPGLKERILAMRSEGMTLQAIADRLNAERVPTIRGGKEWRPSSVQAAAGYKRPRRGGRAE